MAKIGKFYLTRRENADGKKFTSIRFVPRDAFTGDKLDESQCVSVYGNPPGLTRSDFFDTDVDGNTLVDRDGNRIMKSRNVVVTGSLRDIVRGDKTYRMLVVDKVERIQTFDSAFWGEESESTESEPAPAPAPAQKPAKPTKPAPAKRPAKDVF